MSVKAGDNWAENRKELINWKQVIWFASYPKSGNTWLRCFLDAYYRGSADINDIVGSSTDAYIPFATGNLKEELVEAPPEIKILARSHGLLRMVDHYMNEERKYPLILKTHNACVAANGVNLIPWSMTKAVVYLIRNPIKILPSLAAHFGYSLDETIDMMIEPKVAIGADKTREDGGPEIPKFPDFITSWKLHVSSFNQYREEYNTKFFKYEDMLKKPEDVFSDILYHIGLDVDRDRVSEAVEKVKLDRLSAQEKKSGFKELPPNAASAFFGGKREEPTHEQIDRLTQALQPEFDIFYRGK